MRRVLNHACGEIDVGRRLRLVGDIGEVRDPVTPLLDLRVEWQRISRQVTFRCVQRVDLLRALLRVLLRQQSFRRALDERLVAVVAVAVRIGQLQGFDDRMDVRSAVTLHRLEVELLEDVERLEQHRTLAAERLFVGVVAAIRRYRRLLDPGEVVGEVVELPRRLMLFQKRDHLACDVAFVETVAGGGDASAAPLLCRFAFRLHHR